jgi:hypothetical protein
MPAAIDIAQSEMFHRPQCSEHKKSPVQAIVRISWSAEVDPLPSVLRLED